MLNKIILGTLMLGVTAMAQVAEKKPDDNVLR